MIILNSKIPNPFRIAVSGGIDSMVALDFVSRNKHNQFEILHINHGTEHGKLAEEFIRSQCISRNLKLNLHKISNTKPKNESWEEFWRNERYNFFRQFDFPILTAHHLDDVVEFWIMSSLRGNGKLIQRENGNVIRPFLLNSKDQFKEWAERKNVEFIQDESNFENCCDRNIIRNEMMKSVLKINPGIRKTIKKLLLKRDCEKGNLK